MTQLYPPRRITRCQMLRSGIALCIGILLPTDNAYAQLADVLCALYWDIIFADLGRGIATLAICALGVGAMLGKVSWAMAITVGVGLATLFGAAEIAFILVLHSC